MLAGSHGGFSCINKGFGSINEASSCIKGGLARHKGATAFGNADLSLLNKTFSIGKETPASGVARLPYLTKAFP
jgi:hypothetical protein